MNFYLSYPRSNQDKPFSMTMKPHQSALRFVRHTLFATLLGSVAWVSVATEYTASFKGTDISEFINVVGKNLNKTVIIDPAVRGKVDVRSYDLLTEEQYYQFFLSVLEVYGYAAIEIDNNILKIIKDKDAKFAPTPVTGKEGPEKGDEFITRVVPVHNVSVRELAPLLRQLNDNAGGGNVVHYDPSNVLMITGRAAVVDRLVDIVDRVDRAGDQHVDIIDLEYASAAEMVRIIESLSRTKASKTADFLTPKLVADERTNSVIISGEEKARVRVGELVRRLDKELASSGNTRVFYLKYASAEDMVKVLQGVSESISKDGSGNSKGKSRSNTRKDVNIESHEDSNALVITAEPSMMQSLDAVIRQLDIRRAQVHIEAIIVEIMEGDGANLGIQYFSEDAGLMQWNSSGQLPVSGVWAGNIAAEDQPGSTVCTEAGTCTTNPDTQGDYTLLASLLGSVNGMMLGVIEQDWAAVVQAIKSSTNSNILSTPSVTTLDNQEAFFIAGQEVPIITGSTSSSSNSNPFQTVERQEVGVKLKVTPQINEGDAVQLVIEQEVSSVSGATSVDITINKRELKTTVMADDGATVVLGGLIDDSAQESVSKVPLLGDIPIIGELFTSRSVSKQKRNLLIFIRPTIVRDAVSMSSVSNRKYNYMRAQQLSKEYKTLPLVGKTIPVLPEWKKFNEESGFGMGEPAPEKIQQADDE